MASYALCHFQRRFADRALLLFACHGTEVDLARISSSAVRISRAPAASRPGRLKNCQPSPGWRRWGFPGKRELDATARLTVSSSKCGRGHDLPNVPALFAQDEFSDVAPGKAANPSTGSGAVSGLIQTRDRQTIGREMAQSTIETMHATAPHGSTTPTVLSRTLRSG